MPTSRSTSAFSLVFIITPGVDECAPDPRLPARDVTDITKAATTKRSAVETTPRARAESTTSRTTERPDQQLVFFYLGY